MLRDPAPPPAPPPPPPARGRKPLPVVVPAPPPDLVRLLEDAEARIRRRAALAIGRVGLPEGVAPLVKLLGDPDPEVRQMAAFSLGLIGDRLAREPLVAALGDASPLMRGSAAEALGLLGDPAAAPAISRMAVDILQQDAAGIPSGDEDPGRDSPAGAFRLALYALVRLKAYDELAAAVLDGTRPRTTWWPVAFALQRLADPRARPALTSLVNDPRPYTRAFAVKGLGDLKDRASVAVVLPLADGPDEMVAIEAVRALGKLGEPRAAPALIKMVQTQSRPSLRLEAVTALGGIDTEGADGVFETLLDALADPSPPVRAAALRSLARRNPESFITVLSGLDPDPHWSVRAALAAVLGTLPADVALPRLQTMWNDQDERVLPSVVTAMATLRPPDVEALVLERLKHNDPIVRASAAAAVGSLKLASGPAVLADAYRAGQQDLTYTARAAALTALASYGAAAATATLTEALGDADWAVRVRAASLLQQMDPSSDARARIRPAPTPQAPDFYESTRLVTPPVSTQVYLETDRGLIQIELAVVDAPLTVENFVTLARKKFFDGLAFHRVVSNFVIQGGDPRGDSEGGPGYTIRDELNQRPFLRGTVGMALDWADTGGSQFFITHSPQPHLDARYTAFGRVTRGMDVVDQIEPWDVVRRVLVWDGSELR
jgi:HEAT repeat protein/cyclophilin family peptidyl-prolyl cis-trans isomerase